MYKCLCTCMLLPTSKVCNLFSVMLNSSIQHQILVLWEETQKIPSIHRKRSVFLCYAITLFFQISSFSLKARPIGCFMFFNRMPGVMLAFVAANIFKVDECQGHALGATLSEWGSATCGDWWSLSFFFYIFAWRVIAQVSLCSTF